MPTAGSWGWRIYDRATDGRYDDGRAINVVADRPYVASGGTMLARAERFADGHLEESGDFSDAGLWFSFRSVDPGPAHQPFHLGGYEDPP